MNFCSSDSKAATMSDENGETIVEEEFGTINLEQQDVATITNQCA